jgi:hypothetical protein
MTFRTSPIFWKTHEHRHAPTLSPVASGYMMIGKLGLNA